MKGIADKIYWFLRKKYVKWAQYNDPRRLADVLYRDVFHKWIDWNNPQTLNEKINWLVFYTDTSLWSKCTDKYAVREYVESKGLGHILIPLYGKWEKASDIDFSILPDKFVLKPNNGNSDLVVVTNKSLINRSEIIERLSHSVVGKFICSAQPHYFDIKPCIIAEQLLETDNPLGIVDYKVKVFNGKPYCIGTWANRIPMTNTGDFGIYDLNWNPKTEWISDKAMNFVKIPKPEHLEEMLDYAAILGADFEQVRVDFYEVNGKVYFGEMTFTSAGGRDNDYTDEALLEMGHQIKLDKTKKIKKKWDLKKYKPLVEAFENTIKK